MQEDQKFRNDFTPNCREAYDQAVNLTNVSTILDRLVDPSYFDELCSETCLPQVLAHLRGCYGTHDDLAETYEGACLFNQNRTRCYTALHTSLEMFNTSWQPMVTAGCFVNFTQYSYYNLTEGCSDSCEKGLLRVKRELGCCLNAIYNNSFVGEYLPFANYSPWSNCGLESESLGYCTSAGTQPVGVYTMFAAIAVAVLALL